MILERLRPVVAASAPLAERFRAAGKRLYLVGGTVRDAIAGRPGEAARPEELIAGATPVQPRLEPGG